MIGFVLSALLLVVLTVVGLLLPLLRGQSNSRDSGDDDLTTEAYRERLAELRREHENGALSADELREATDELERELLASQHNPAGPAMRGSAPPTRTTAIALAVVVPLCAVLLYGVTGHPQLVGDSPTGGLGRDRIERLQNMVPEAQIEMLQDWLADNPDSARGWSMLAQAYRDTGAFGDAIGAFARARAAGANDAWLIARQAETLLLANERRFTRSVWRLLEEALQQNPRNGLALMLAGQGAFVGGDMEQAASYWRRLAEALPEGDNQRAMIEQLVARAEAAAAGHADGMASSTGNTNAPADTETAAGPSLKVNVSLSDSLGATAQPGDTVFVFARSPGGGGPPRAVARTQVGALPASITLTDANAMAPQFRLSGADQVVVTARVSRSGQAQAQSGDLQGSSAPVAVAGESRVDVVIDSRVP